MKSGVKFLKTGSERLAELSDFKLVGREQELDQLSTILTRKKSNSVLMFGPGGVGVSALVLGLQASKSDPNAPYDIISKRFFWIDTDGLFKSGNCTEISGYFNKIVYTLQRTPDSVLVIEDTKNFLDACARSGCMHFVNALTLMVKEHKTQIILEARDTDVEFISGIHSDIKDHFATLAVGEPEATALKAIVDSIGESLSKFHKIKIDPEALKFAIKMTTENRSKEANLNRAQPDRTTTLLDFALATYKKQAHSNIPESTQKVMKSLIERKRVAEIDLINAEYAIKEENEYIAGVKSQDKTIDEISDALSEGGFETPKMKSLREVEKLNHQIVKELDEQVELLLKDVNDKLLLTKDHVVKQYSQMTGIPVAVLVSDERIVMRDLHINIKKEIFGQDANVDAIADMIRRATFGRKKADEPGAAMLLGPSGVGKTEVWKVVAKILGRPLFIFDMAEYSEKNSGAKLVGAVPGYELAGVGGQLTNAALEFPYGIFVFDEIEKAHDNLFNSFLSVLSDGRLTDNVGRKCSFKKAIVGFTSNIGQPRFLDTSLTWEQQVAAATEDLNKTFRSEFLNRFAGRENIFWFNALKLDSLEKIVRREFTNINKEYESKGIITEISDEEIKQFVADRYDPVRGARGLPGVINKSVDSIIINSQLENPDFRGTLKVEYDLGDKKLITNLVDLKKAA